MQLTENIRYSWIISKISLLLFILSPLVMIAQTPYQLTAGKNNTIKVGGTSNVHDWTMTAKEVESSGIFKFNTRNELTDISSLRFSVVAKSLKSEKTSMDGRTYKSMKADQFPKVTYQLSTATVTMVQDNKYAIQTTGLLTIAGKTQTINMKVMALVNSDRTVSCHGTQKLMLTDYGIEPPSFMLGAMKVGNDLQIRFDLTYTK